MNRYLGVGYLVTGIILAVLMFTLTREQYLVATGIALVFVIGDQIGYRRGFGRWEKTDD